MPVWQTPERGQRGELSIFAFVVVVVVSCTIFHAFKGLPLPRLVRLYSYYSTAFFHFYKHAVASNRQSNSRGPRTACLFDTAGFLKRRQNVGYNFLVPILTDARTLTPRLLTYRHQTASLSPLDRVQIVGRTLQLVPEPLVRDTQAEDPTNPSASVKISELTLAPETHSSSFFRSKVDSASPEADLRLVESAVSLHSQASPQVQTVVKPIQKRVEFDAIEISAFRRAFPLGPSFGVEQAFSPTSTPQTNSSSTKNNPSPTQNSPQSTGETPLPSSKMTGTNRRSQWATVKATPRRTSPNNDWQSDAGDAWLTNQRPDNSYQLADWQGQWAPVPVQWGNRPHYVDHAIRTRIAEWQTLSESEVHSVQLTESLDRVAGDIAPRAWALETIDEHPAAIWWARHLKSPDFESGALWWTTYAAKDSDCLPPIVVPESRVDRTDNNPLKLGQTSAQSSLSFSNSIYKRMHKARECSKVVVKEVVEEMPPPHPYAPQISIYLRPAGPYDIAQIAEIYNYYIEKTVFSPELTRLSVSEVRSRWTDVNDARLPFLVAVDKSSKGNKKNRPRNGQPQDEHIVGFAYADDYNDIRGMYRYTVEVEVFTKPEYLRKGVGRCLMDKIMSTLDLAYLERGGYDFVVDGPGYGAGGKRVIGSIIANIPHGSKDLSRIKWLRNWLGQWEFEQCAHFNEVGHKLNIM